MSRKDIGNYLGLAEETFLSDWLRNHILTVDKKLAAALRE